MPPVYVTNAGRATASFMTERLVMEKLFDADGSAVIVHYGPDNSANIPAARYSSTSGSVPDAATLRTGDSGARLACGVLQ
jgi:Cu-Zn family superoxide dismutase